MQVKVVQYETGAAAMVSRVMLRHCLQGNTSVAYGLGDSLRSALQDLRLWMCLLSSVSVNEIDTALDSATVLGGIGPVYMAVATW